MKSLKFNWILICSLISIFMFGCKPEEIILHGEIIGYVTDTTNNQPIQSVPVKLNPVNYSTNTTNDGKYLFKSLIPGDYKIEVSKLPYAKTVRSATVNSANTTEVNLALHKIQYPEFSERRLDFGFDSTFKSFTIKNTGTGKLNYVLLTSQDWISVNTTMGEVTTEIDTIKVRIDKSGLSEKKHIGSIEVDSYVGLDIIRDTIHIYINGFLDQRDFTYYDIVKIGTQTWMAENLNFGKQISSNFDQRNNLIAEKYCYGNDKNNCDVYGGLYQWGEAMQYNPSEDKPIGTTQGICPDGWHIPTGDEWSTLVSFVHNDNYHYANTAWPLKEAGTAHWNPPNSGTDEYGFTALPGGFFTIHGRTFMTVRERTIWWTSTIMVGYPEGYDIYSFQIIENESSLQHLSMWETNGSSVRCIKDSPKK